MTPRTRTVLVTALRVAVTACLLFVAFIMIDFSDRVVFHLKSGERVEAFSWSEKDGQIHAVISKDQSECRDFSASEVESRVEQPGLSKVLKRARSWPAILVAPALGMLFFFLAARWRML